MNTEWNLPALAVGEVQLAPDIDMNGINDSL